MGILGWNLVLVGTRALVVNGSWANMVELRLEPWHRTRLLLVPLRVPCVRLSLEEPDAFLAALGAPEAAR